VNTVGQFISWKLMSSPSGHSAISCSSGVALVDGRIFSTALFYQHTTFHQHIKSQRLLSCEPLYSIITSFWLTHVNPRNANSFFRHHSYMDSISASFVAVHFNGPAMMVSVNPDAFSNNGRIRFLNSKQRRLVCSGSLFFPFAPVEFFFYLPARAFSQSLAGSPAGGWSALLYCAG